MDDSAFRHEVIWDGIRAVLRVFRRRYRLFLGSGATILVCALIYLALRAPQYAAESSFVPEAGESNASRLAGLAVQFGLSLGGGQTPGVPVVFYSELLTSNGLLTEVARSQFVVGLPEGDTLRGTPAELLQVKGRGAEDTERRTVQKLRRMVSATTYRDAGLVRLRTTSKWAGFAVALNRRMLELVNQFNLERRQSQARSERQFIEHRVEAAEAALRAAEDQQRRFFERNRSYRESPELVLEAARLQRTVDQKQQVYSQLTQGYEQARINEVRNTPVVTAVDVPEGSQRRVDRPVFDAVLWLLLSGVIALALTLGVESLDRYRLAQPEGYEDLRRQSRLHLRRAVGD